MRSIYEGAGGIPVPVFSLADVLSFLAYPLLFLALVLYPFENRYAPSRFRFLLDVTISAGVVATLVGLMLGRLGPALIAGCHHPAGLSDCGLDPAGDPVQHAAGQPHRPAGRSSCGAAGCSRSWYPITYIVCWLRSMASRPAGWKVSAGWRAGLFLDGGRFSRRVCRSGRTSRSSLPSDLGTRLQNILPFAFVLALGWVVLAEWRLSGQISWLGAGISLFLTLALVVRMGVRAGEIELHQYWQLFSSMAEPIFICDADGKIRLGNPALVRALGPAGGA